MATRRRRRKCRKYGYKKVLQDYGPAKRVRYCKSYGKTARGGRARRGGWCVTRGKQTVRCFKLKRVAQRAAVRLRKRCRAKVGVRRRRG